MEVSFISKKVMTNDDLVNENIRFKEVLVIGPKGEQLGVMMRREALEKAYDYELDLLCVAPNGNPPVCKIVDYGRYRFESQKKAKEAKRNQHVTEVKPMRLSLEVGKKVMNSFVEQMSDIASVEKAPALEGNTMSVVLTPKKK